jgi:peptidoglycan/xylan/chitin deacetylase (PgdA/CDA1 family)
MGEITWFIEGPWVQELPELLKKIKAHEKSVRDQRSIPKLEAMKKRFGL